MAEPAMTTTATEWYQEALRHNRYPLATSGEELVALLATEFGDDDRIFIVNDRDDEIQTWNGLAYVYDGPPGKGLNKRRKRVDVARHPICWPVEDLTRRPQTCSSIFKWARRPNGTGPGGEFRHFHRTNPVVWKITERHGRRSYLSYWCDAELPDKYREIVQ